MKTIQQPTGRFEIMKISTIPAQDGRRRIYCSLTILTALLLAVAFATPGGLLALDSGALPQGGRITAGQGSIATAGSAMTVTQQSARMAADWNSFNIGSNASVSFVQPSAASVALNRIHSATPSQIFGQLSANGQVFLLNPAGIIFGSTAQVNVGGLVASSLALSDDDFMAGNYTFQGAGPEGFVLNQGTIRSADGGYLAFIAPHVENQGQMASYGGTVALAAGNRVQLDFTGDRLVNYIVDKGALDALAANSGAIRADGGAVLLTAKAADTLTRSVVNHTGVIEAQSLADRNGRIVLTADADGGDVRVSGRIDISGADNREAGGILVATAESVTLDGGASVDASGSAGGGEIYLGGGWQGSDPQIANATETVIDLGTRLDASAMDDGNGGTVVVWSDGNTFFNGTILSRGGDGGGDGGRVEVSGKENLGFWGNVDVLSPLGQNGLLLLDPSNITIVDGAAGQTGTYADWSNHGDYGSYVIPETVLEALAGDVILTAVSNITIANLSDNVLNLSANSISFFSNDESGPSSSGGFSMDVSDTIRLSGAGDLTLQGGSAYVASAGGSYSIYASSLETNGGNVIFNTKRSSAAAPIRVTGTITTNGGNVSVAPGTRFGLVNSSNVDVQLDGLIATSGGDFSSNMIGTVKIGGGMNLGAGSASFGGTGTQINSVITSTADVTIAAPLTFGAGSGITTTGTLTFDQAASMSGAGNSLTLTASNFVFNNTFAGNSGNITLKPYNAGTNVDLGSAGAGDMVILNASLLKLTGFAGITIGRTDGTGTTKVVSSASAAAGRLELINRTIDVSAGTLSNTGGDIVLTGDTFDIGQAVTANGGAGRVVLQQLTPGNTLTLGTGVTDAVLDRFNAGTLVVGRTDGGDVVFDGNISTTSSQVHFLSGGNITIDNGASLGVGAGTAVIAAGGNFINNAGAGAISTSGNGRWLVYSTKPADNTFGGLASDSLALWNRTYAGYPPASVTETGSRYLFSHQPGATVTAVNRNKTYGETLDMTGPVLGTRYTVTGMVDAAVYGNVFSQAAAADIVSGSPVLASAGAASGGAVAGSPYALTIAAGTLTAPTGYSLAYTAGTVTVGKAPLSVTASAAVKTYDALAYSGGNGVTYGGFVNGETAAVLGGSLAYGGTSQGARNAGSYAITPSGLTSGNYAITFTGGALTVNKANLNIAARADTKGYDGGVSSAVAPLVNGLQGADTITGLGQTFADKNVGSGKALSLNAYTINDGNGGNNYNVTAAASNDGVITAKNLTVAYTAANKIYDATTAATVTGASADIIVGDAISFSQSAVFVDKNAGAAMTVNVTGISLGGADAGNYSLQNNTAVSTADIAAKSLTAAYTASNKVYDATTAATVTGASADIIAGDVVTFSESSAFVDKNAGAAKTVNVTAINLGGADAGNYSLQNVTAATTADITVREIQTVGMIVQDKIYDGTTDARIILAGAGLAGVIAGDDVHIDTAAISGSFEDPYVELNKAVLVSGLTLSGTDIANYRLEPYRPTATIFSIDTSNLTSPQRATNGTQEGQAGSAGGQSTLGPGAGSASLTGVATAFLVTDTRAGGNATIVSNSFSSPVAFSSSETGTTLVVGGGNAGFMAEVCTLPVFSQSGSGAPAVRGSFMVRENPSALSLAPAAGAVETVRIGADATAPMPFTLSTPSGLALQMTATVTTQGVLVIDMPATGAPIAPGQAVLMGMMVAKKELNVDVGSLKGVLLRQDKAMRPVASADL